MLPRLRSNSFLALVPLALSLAAVPLMGQQGQQLRVERISELTFGDVVAGTSVVVQPTDPAAGKFLVRGLPNRSIRIAFTLPTRLESGATLLPVTFGPQSASWSASDQVTSSVRFDPAAGLDITVPPGRSIYIWIGGRVAPASGQQAGGYAGPVTLTATMQ
jgi:hypothetical protein